MNLNGFIESLELAASKYMITPRIMVKTDNAIKARVEISDDIYVQFYHHQITETSNFVLVGWNRRLYGRDSVGGKWHRHPFEVRRNMTQQVMVRMRSDRRYFWMKCSTYY